jgi:hypothetical protein
MTEVVGWHSDTYGLHRHPWLTEPEENFVAAALRRAIPNHAACRPLTWADPSCSDQSSDNAPAESGPVGPGCPDSLKGIV